MATHRVVKGNSLVDLAKLYYQDGKAASPLAAANELDEGASLKPGSTLKLPLRLYHFDKLTARREMSTTVVTGICNRRSDLLFVRVREETLTTRANVVSAISGKWFYVASGGSIVVRAEVPTTGEWKIENLVFDGQRFASDETVVLIAGREYRYLLSPHKLHPAAEQRFAERAERFWSVERQAGKADEAEQGSWTVLLRDAYQWAHDVHQMQYVPRLDAYRRWVAEHADQLFIASTLKCLVEAQDKSWYGDDVDPLDLVEHLRPGEPNNYLTNVYQKGIDEPRLKAEAAAARLATLLGSEEHRTLELSAMQQGEAPLEATTLMWANVLECISETRPGRKLLQELARDRERFPLRHVLTSSVPANTLPFPQVRYLANALIAIIKDLAPAWLALHQAEQARSKLYELADFISFAAGQRVTVVEKSFEAMHENLMQGVWLGTDVKYRRTTRLLLEGTSGYNQAMQAARTIDVPARSLAENVRLAESLARSAKLIGFRGCLETINFANAYRDYSADSSRRKAMGLVGAAADLSALVVDVGVTLFQALDKAAIRGVGASLGIISGVCDSVEFGLSAKEAANSQDYDAAVGLAIATAGASMITVGSGLALFQTAIAGLTTVESSVEAGTLLSARTLTAIKLGRVGSMIGILGAALAGGGALVWHFAKDSSYQQFASHCFLGRAYGQTGMTKPDWTWRQFPTSDRAVEAEALVQLLSAFDVSLEMNPTAHFATPYRLKIVPGFYGESDMFEIYLEHSCVSEPINVAARLTIHISSGEVRQQGGELMAPIVEVVREENGRVSSIHVSENYADRERLGARKLLGRVARVRLQAGPGDYLPSQDYWVGVQASVVQDLNRIQANSSDTASHINSSAVPLLKATSR